MPVYFLAGARMRPDEPHRGVITQCHFKFGKIEGVALALGRYVAMDHDRQIMFGGQVIDTYQRLAVGPGRFALGERRKVIMAGKYLTDPFPHTGIGLQEPAYMFIRVLVVGIESGQKRMKTLA